MCLFSVQTFEISRTKFCFTAHLSCVPEAIVCRSVAFLGFKVWSLAHLSTLCSSFAHILYICVFDTLGKTTIKRVQIWACIDNEYQLSVFFWCLIAEIQKWLIYAWTVERKKNLSLWKWTLVFGERDESCNRIATDANNIIISQSSHLFGHPCMYLPFHVFVFRLKS